MTHVFSVPKGDDDIRMVYNGTSIGINYILWDPNFDLPKVRNILREI